MGRQVRLSFEDFETIGYDVPLLVDMQPAGEYLGEDYYRAGGCRGANGMVLQPATKYQRVAQKFVPRDSHRPFRS